MRNYVTVSGDTWDMIAFRLYPETGGEVNMPRLIMANEEFADTAVFRAGVVLNVPEELVSEPKTLPPWRR